MKTRTRHTGELRIIERLPSSQFGNPRYLMTIDGWTCRTSPDSSYAYVVPNFNGKIVTAVLGTYYGKTTLFQLEAAE